MLDRILDKSDIKASLQCYLQKVEEGQRLQGKTKSEIKIECMKAERDVRRRLGNKILDAIHNSICMEEGNRVPLDSEELSDGGNRVPLGSEELLDGGNRVPLDSEELLDGGNPVPSMKQSKDIVKMIKDFTKLADSPEENIYAAYRLGCIYMDETMPESYNLQKGIQFLEKAALQHNPDAEIKLGIAYYFGKGVLKDKERGEQYLQAAIADGSEYAQNILDAGGLNVAYCLTKSVLSGLETMNRQQTYYNNQQSHSRQALREKQLHSDQNRDI